MKLPCRAALDVVFLLALYTPAVTAPHPSVIPDAPSGGGPRVKRSVSLERNVETLLVADRTMVEYYSNEDLQTYLLTVLNMVGQHACA